MARLILGHTTHDSIKIWVRASSRWPVAFVDVYDTADRRTGDTQVIATEPGEFYTGVCTWKGLAPSSEYKAKVSFGKSINASEEERVRAAYTTGRFQTFPPPDKKTSFTFLLGSCNFHSLGILEKPDKAWIQMSEVAKNNGADFMIHCGDQIYADIPLPPPLSLEHYRDKYLDAWDDCVPARKFLTELPHYMILDDHEITNNFDNDMPGNRDFQALARIAIKVYWMFQHSHNPDTPSSPWQYHYTLEHGATQFFVMDTRFYRSSRNGEMIDPAQEQALLDWLRDSPDKVKFVVTSVPFVAETRRDTDDKWCSTNFQEQRHRIIEHILHHKVSKVVFLTGDMHIACRSRLKVSRGDETVTIHELMSSPINQITPDTELEKRLVPRKKLTLESGTKLDFSTHAGSFYGDHSNVMAIEVVGDERIKFRIYRTSRRQNAPEKYGSINLG